MFLNLRADVVKAVSRRRLASRISPIFDIANPV